jgi:hypothetical protein
VRRREFAAARRAVACNQPKGKRHQPRH